MFALLKDATEMDDILLILCFVIHRSIIPLQCQFISIKPPSCLLHSVRNSETESQSNPSDCSQVGMNVFSSDVSRRGFCQFLFVSI